MISEVTFFLFWWVAGGVHVTKYKPESKSHCSRKGLNSYAMSLHSLSIASIPRQKYEQKTNYKWQYRPVYFHICIDACTMGVHLNSGKLDLNLY